MAITDANTRRGLVARLIGFGSSPAEAGPRAPLGPTVALTISLAVACFVVALGVVELTSTPHRLPPPYGSENQPAESALYAIGFAVILPLVVIAAPRIAGQHPIYLARELYLFKDGSRNGMTSKLMTPAVMNLTDADILAISAYLASMDPTGTK